MRSPWRAVGPSVRDRLSVENYARDGSLCRDFRNEGFATGRVRHPRKTPRARATAAAPKTAPSSAVKANTTQLSARVGTASARATETSSESWRTHGRCGRGFPERRGICNGRPCRAQHRRAVHGAQASRSDRRTHAGRRHSRSEALSRRQGRSRTRRSSRKVQISPHSKDSRTARNRLGARDLVHRLSLVPQASADLSRMRSWGASDSNLDCT